ncbi:hypothetical protein [Nitrobacter sp. JJSN]|uniref:hypothetical protein n=1 Tax=Nitrobacter sp. JJSN TaxID=3453033 RepID=UPI003F75D7C6
MSFTMLTVKRGDSRFRLLRFDARPDGSIVVLVDRDPSPKTAAKRLGTDGVIVDDVSRTDQVTEHGKVSCHTTGQVNRYASGEFADKIIIEPLHQLTRTWPVLYYSVPAFDRLDPCNGRKTFDAEVVLEFPAEVTERVTFMIQLVPKDAVPTSFGARLQYEVYSVLVEVVPESVPPELQQHFIEASLAKSPIEKRHVGIAESELAFHSAVHGPGMKVFRETGGAYVILATVPKRVPPRLQVHFSRAGLEAEQIPPEGNAPVTHKVKFWIRDKGGRSRKDDLRKFIASIALDARL